MKKQEKVKGIKIGADELARNLKRGAGEIRAHKIAADFAKFFKTMQPTDINTDLMTVEEVRKNERIWTQVHNIYQKAK